ncbi:hypothetical protein [Paenibacillus tarimensis]|uniref:hypothetical protein n=1 Tax=Paenibacillus tarimensis TaxID=416012 RepID=UPI001F1E4EA1|nr:hypothetical protein [Paenibacillus tarimensis]MCF2946033.1 hypothetical protein [Paenibacillus tarimensis]
MKITAVVLMRVAGLCAVLAGILYIVIQFIHPSDSLSSVSSSLWVIVACMTSAMSLFSLIGITGIYIRQAGEAGWLGLAGYVLFSSFWLISFAFSFIEAFVLPLLTTDAPEVVEGFTGLFSGIESGAELGIFPVLAPLAGGMYILGGLLFGIAVLRAGILPRPAAGLLSIAAVMTVMASVIPHPFDRTLAVPMGSAFVWLGLSLWSPRIQGINTKENAGARII